MNIKVVSEKTGLTKKAIKYYESEGLINPVKNENNSYREYTEDDIVKLNLIGALRAIDIPTNEIKCLVDGNKNLQDVLKNTLDKITETIGNLEKSRLVISSIMNKNLQDYNIIGEQVKKLRETLEFSVSEKKEFISDTLLRIFPGNYGKVIVNIYEPFLNITIDSIAKKDVWLKLVEFLDDLNELDDTNPFIKGCSNTDISNMDKINLFSDDASVTEKYKKDIVSFVRSVIENEEMRKKVNDAVTKTRDILNDAGIEDDNILDEYLEILNEDYKKFRDIIRNRNKEIDEEVKKIFGFTWNEFCQNIHEKP